MMRFALGALLLSAFIGAQTGLPSSVLAMRDFRLQLDAAGTFTLGGDPGWPPMAGRWTVNGNQITLQNDPGPSKCDGAATYRFAADAAGVGFDVVADQCQARQMILDRSRWTLPGVTAAVVIPLARAIGIASLSYPRISSSTVLIRREYCSASESCRDCVTQASFLRASS